MPREELVEAIKHLGPVLLHGLLAAERFAAAAVFGDQPLECGKALGLRERSFALFLRHAGFQTQLLFQILEAEFVVGLRLVANAGEGGIEQFAQAPTVQCLGLLVGDDLAKEGMNLAVVAANDAVETKIECFGFVKLEKLGHQLDKTGFHLLPLRWQSGYFRR
ncbi:MAG: hypothetical protein ACOYNV_17695 [Propionivibrio sp.]